MSKHSHSAVREIPDTDVQITDEPARIQVQNGEQTAVDAVRQLKRIVAPEWGTVLASCPTNLDLSTTYGKLIGVNCQSPANIDLDENGHAEINARYWLIYPDESTDEESGEVRRHPRTVFIAINGDTLKTTAAHGPDFVQRVNETFGPDIWSRGIRISITERRSKRQKQTYHDLRVVSVNDSEPF
jgi:hypothetical protein